MLITAFGSIDPLTHCSRARTHETQCNGGILERQLPNKLKQLLLQGMKCGPKVGTSKPKDGKTTGTSKLKNIFGDN